MKRRLLWLPPLAAAIIFVSVYASSKEGNKTTAETRYQAAPRMIGHQLLLSTGDQRSRVLPVRQLSSHKFEIHFEKPLSLQPDSLFNILNNVVIHSSLPKDYTAEVRQCRSKEVMYSFVMASIDSNTIVPCMGRTLPKDCYFLAIDFDPATPGLPGNTYAWMAAAVILLGAWSYFLYRKASKNARVETKETTGNSIQVGQFVFNPANRYLEINKERTDLTDKEAKLLHILALSPNITVDREQLQKEVWENEGVIVTRSLDVFISRLRKKLEKDPGIRLTNVHGKGYKLEVLA